MNINITFFIQIINFFVTYKLLNVLFFKPIIKSIEKKKQKEESVNLKINNQEQVLLNLQKEKVEHVVSFQSHVKKDYPFISPYERMQFIDIEIEQDVSIADTAELAKDVSDWIVKKVGHVC